MPIQPLATDDFTRDNLLLGFSQVSFTPSGSGVSVPLGILSSESLGKVVEVLQLQSGESGTLSIVREIVSRLEFFMTLETFNLKANVAQFLLGSDVLTAVTADAAAVLTTPDAITLDADNPFGLFYELSRADINEGSVEVTCAAIADEAVGTGDGSANNFALDYKVKAVGDVTSVTVGGVAYTPVGAGAATAGNEVEVTVGESDAAHPTGSGSLVFFQGGVAAPPANGAAIVASYTPSFNTTAGDIANLTDFVFDPFLGAIRFLNAGADASPFKPNGDEQPLLVDFTYNRRAHVLLNPGRQSTFDGSAQILHAPNVGINFLWTIPSATLRLTDDELTFGAENFGTGTLRLNINDAGGSDRFGTIEWSSELEANA